MIEQLILRDFQSHHKTKITFDHRITTIVGPTDSGKSSIIRALQWLATNRPAGEAFVRDDAEISKIILKVDGREIRRTKGKGRNAKNTYAIDGKILKAFGGDVPSDVSTLLNITGANFQSQYDAPFWFAETPGNVSRSLNAIINLSIIDDTLASLSIRSRTASTRTAVCTEQLAGAKAEWDKQKPAKEMDRALQKVEAQAEKARISRIAANLALGLVGGCRRYGEAIKNAAALQLMGVSVVSTGNKWENLTKSRKTLDRLVRLATQAKSRAAKLVPDISRLTALADAMNSAMAKRDGIATMVKEVVAAKSHVEKTKRVHHQHTEQFIHDMGKVCPLCEQSIKGNHAL